MYGTHINRLEDLTRTQDLGHVLAAVRTDLFVSDAEFRARMDAILSMLKAAPPAPGAERVMVPGEIELANEASARTHGIALPSAIATQLAQFGELMAVPFPSPLEVSGRS